MSILSIIRLPFDYCNVQVLLFGVDG